MDIQTTPLQEKSQVKIQIKASAEELKPYLEKAAKKLSQDNPPKGFRPGKTSLDAAVKIFGQERLLNEAINKAIPNFFVQAVIDNDIEALGRPDTTIEKIDLVSGIAFTAIVDVLPQVTLGDASKIKVSKRPVITTDEKVVSELKVLAKSRSTFLDVARPALTGDTVTVDFKVSINGAPMEGGASKNHPIHLGEGHFVPDFEKKLVGITAGDEREFTITFPKDFGNKELRGKEAKAQVKAHSVQQRAIPELNDEFAKNLGKFESLQQLKDELKKNIQTEDEQKEQDRYRGELAHQLAELSTFGHLPDQLINRDIDRRLEELTRMLSLQKKTIEDYLKQQSKTIAQVREEMRPSAVDSTKISLALRSFAIDHDIKVADKEVETKMQEYLKNYSSTEQAKQEVDKNELRDSITNNLRNQLVFKKLEELATIETAAPQPKK